MKTDTTLFENSQTACEYWNKLKQRLLTERSQLVTNFHQLKMTDEGDKEWTIDVATAEILRRLFS